MSRLLRIVFLGTSAGLPTVERGLSSLALLYDGQMLLFDCGEGVQRQLLKAKLGFGKKFRIFITHFHGDHFLGLPGLLQTMSLLDRREKVEVYGPEGLREFLEAVSRVSRLKLQFPLELYTVKDGVVLREKGFQVSARLMEHTLPNFAYAFVEKKRPGRFHPERASALGVPQGPLWRRLQMGRSVKLKGGRVVRPEEVRGPPRPGIKVVYSGDSKPSRRMVAFARRADLLIHECTFDDSLKEKAEHQLHSTPSGVAELSRKASVKRLVLTHISARYSSADRIRSQAAQIFPNVEVAEDFMRINL